MRRGFTLIEMIGVISIGSALTGVAISLLVMLLQVERTGRAHIEENRAIYELADQFRRDVRAAERVVVNCKEKTRIVYLTGIAHYEADNGEVERVEARFPQTNRRESYLLPVGWSATVEVESKTQPELVRMTLAPKDASLRAVREVRVEAILGQDFRFQRGEEEK